MSVNIILTIGFECACAFASIVLKCDFFLGGGEYFFTRFLPFTHLYNALSTYFLQGSRKYRRAGKVIHLYASKYPPDPL